MSISNRYCREMGVGWVRDAGVGVATAQLSRYGGPGNSVIFLVTGMR